MPTVHFNHSDGSNYPVDPDEVFTPEILQHMQDMADAVDPIIVSLTALPSKVAQQGSVMFKHDDDCGCGVKWVHQTEIDECDCFAKPVGVLGYLN